MTDNLSTCHCSGRPLRVAWIGTEPYPGGGAAGAGWLIMQGLAARGFQIDVFCSGDHPALVARFSAIDGVRVFTVDAGWRYDRWYSRHTVTKFVIALLARALSRNRLMPLLLEQHRSAPYDVIYQFSTIEIIGLRRMLAKLPPLVIHPQTHAAGELRWLRAERALSARCEPLWRRALVELVMSARVRRQRHDIKLASRVVAISPQFGNQIQADYEVDPDRIVFVRNPVDLDKILPAAVRKANDPLRITFVGRFAVRKGVELLVDLSHRLSDLEGQVVLELIGDHSTWSDYRPLLRDLNPRIARYLGPMDRAEVAAFLASSDLFIQPAKYEPFGLTLAEALAAGTPVVASDEVGAGDEVSPDCCLVVPASDPGALEAGVRAMLARLRSHEVDKMRSLARSEAERLYSSTEAAAGVIGALLAAR